MESIICYVVKFLKQEIALLNKSHRFQCLEMSKCVCVSVKGVGGGRDVALLFWCWNREEVSSEIFQHSDNQTLAH